MTGMTPSPSQEAFEFAKTEFLDNLIDSKDYDFSEFTSVNQVYEATENIQKEQGKTGTLRNLRKIKPYLDCLSQYAGVVDTFVQVKPDILALIWGPIKLLLQISSSFIKSYDKVLDAMAQIGQCLPHFESYGNLFRANDRVRQVLCIFYKDILDFHITALNFFKAKGWKVFFESLWPRYAAKISIILNNMARHKLLMDSEVTLANIGEAYAARSRAYEEYEKNQASWQRQHFESAKLSVSPRLYDYDLEKIRERCCEETGRWIWKEDAFCSWYDLNDLSTCVLWLVGMPGAGKTFLTSAIIQQSISSGQNVVFAFLTYQNSQTATKLGILHSFIFQLLLDHPDLQATLLDAYESNYRQFTSSASFVEALFREILKCLGKTYIVVDGLDEASENERQNLIKMLLAISKDCVEAKLLFSCREETDISRLLKAQAKSIYIGCKNTNDISKYIDSATENWFATLNVGVTEILEIKQMLKPVAVKSEGMFLYARLVVADLASRGNMQEIREEACNLPDGLDEAYGRIISRIEKSLRPRDRLEARKILEWVGCSKTSLRVTELEHALVIQEGDRNLAWDRKAFKDMIQLCGPIVEIQGETISFVHFTVKEYLFGTQSNCYLKEAEANQNIARTCISYLGFDCFETDLTDADVKKSILLGEYALQGYAESQWFYHVERGAYNLDDLSSTEAFCKQLLSFLNKAQNPNFKGCSEKILAVSKSLKPLQQDWPHLHSILSLQNWFTNTNQSQFSEPDASSLASKLMFLDDLWANSDPLLISKSSLKVRRQFETLICKDKRHLESCHCDTLRKFYGKRIFKCDKFYCPFFRNGFENYSDRDSHILSHERLFKCSFQNCDFSEIGFTTRSLLLQHLEVHRPNSQDLISIPPPTLDEVSQIDINQILCDAVEAGESSYVNSLIQQAASPPLEKLLNLAIHGFSAPVLMLILTKITNAKCMEPPDVLLEAIRGGNPELLASVIKAVGLPDSRDSRKDLLRRAIFKSSPEMIEVLLDSGVERSYDEILKDLFSALCRDSSLEQERAGIKCIELLGDTPNNLIVTSCLRAVVKRHFSCELIRFLLNQGADINSIGSGWMTGGGIHQTPLQFACRSARISSANTIKFLLLNGADPSAKSTSRTIEIKDMVRAGKKISKWLGITWDELVKQTREARESGQAEDEIQLIIEAERTGRESAQKRKRRYNGSH